MRKFKLKSLFGRYGEKFYKGDVVFEYNGCDYGCCSPNEVAVTKIKGETPFFGIPNDFLEEIN